MGCSSGYAGLAAIVKPDPPADRRQLVASLLARSPVTRYTSIAGISDALENMHAKYVSRAMHKVFAVALLLATDPERYQRNCLVDTTTYAGTSTGTQTELGSP